MFVPPRGKCCPFFFLFVFLVSGPLSFAFFLSFLFFLGSFFGKIFGCELLFLGGCVGLVFFWWVFANVFALFFGVFAPETVWKNSIDVRSGFFWVRSLFLRFFADVCFFKSQSSGSHRTSLHTRLFFWFFFFLCPAAFVCFARFGRASRFLAFFRGAILGPARFWDSP